MVGGDSGGGGVVAGLVTFMQLVPSLFLFFVLVPAQHPNACKEHASLAGFVAVVVMAALSISSTNTNTSFSTCISTSTVATAAVAGATDTPVSAEMLSENS